MTTTKSSSTLSMPQCGQAVVEAFVAFLALAVLWTGVAWLGRIQDLAVQASHASRHAAFVATRHDHNTSVKTVHIGLFQGQNNQWRDRRGQPLQQAIYSDVDVSFRRTDDVLRYSQDTATQSRLAQLGKDWLNTDKRLLSAQVSLNPSGIASERTDFSLLKLVQFDTAYPSIHRQTSILTGAGHSSDDRIAADRIAKSGLAWADATAQSSRLGRRVASVATQVDAAWHRPAPIFDWLQPWSDDLPSHHLRTHHRGP